MNNSNFFENYAKDLIEQGEIQKHWGGIKGVCSEAKRLAMEKARAAKNKPEIFEAKKQEEEVKSTSQEESPKVPLFDCRGKLDLSSYKDEDLVSLAAAFQKAIEEERAIRARRAHVQKVLSVIKEMIASEGLSWDEILKEDGVL